ncbi:MmyB family transcriptional regulator [Azohydromonas australica]|uniref:MmyB family transcriptional regulator n=1 Tax=Azohydromonas australica TaxID=364039 RepID=UPI0003FAB1C1|nr:hypothetical protein [Azohydromonas australica]
MHWLLDMPEPAPLPSGGINVLRLMLDPRLVCRYPLNQQEVGADLLHWIQREALGDGLGSEAATLLAELLALPGIATAAPMAKFNARALPFLPMQLRKDATKLNLFTTIATLGTPHDVTVHELRVEIFFPADEATARWFQQRSTCKPGT